MCEVRLYRCPTHSMIRAYQLNRCEPARQSLGDGVPGTTPIMEVNEVPRFEAELGCPDGPPKIVPHVPALSACPAGTPNSLDGTPRSACSERETHYERWDADESLHVWDEENSSKNGKTIG